MPTPTDNAAPGVFALNPLIIPVMDYGSARPGLGYDDLNDPARPLVMQAFLNPLDYYLGDFITLYWGTEIVQTFTLEQPHFENGFMGFSVPLSYLQGTEGVTHYTVHNFSSGLTTPSSSRTVLIKRLPPGGLDTDLATPYMNDRLSLAVISPPGEINDQTPLVTVTIAPWEYMAEGDVLTVMWNGVRLRQPALPAAEVGKAQIITIPKETLIEGGDGDPVTVNYEIRDIVDNYSLVSRPSRVRVIVDPNAPFPPLIKVNGIPVTLIDLASLGDRDVQVEIPSARLTPGDMITLNWLGRTADGGERIITLGPEPVPAGGFNLEFTVTNADILIIAGGGAIVSYHIKPLVGPEKTSRSSTITVNGQPARLEAPTLKEAVGSVIDPGVVPPTATVVIKPYSGKAVGDFITLLWSGTTENGIPLILTPDYTVRAGEENDEYLFLVDKKHIDALANGSLTLRYTVLSSITKLETVSETASYTVSALPGTILDDFSTHRGALITEGQTLTTDFTTLQFVSGDGRLGFPVVDAVPPGAERLQLPVLHLCYQQELTKPNRAQVVLISLNRACTKVECDVYGSNGKLTIESLDSAQTVIDRQTLPNQKNYHFSYSNPTRAIHFLRITADRDWSYWDNLEMTL